LWAQVFNINLEFIMKGFKQFKDTTKHFNRPKGYADGGAVEPHSIPPAGAKQDAPHGNVNFADFKKGGKARAGKSKR
jgi:hypothetical protein